MAQKSDAAVVRLPDGQLTNARLHEQLTEGVNDHDLRMRTKQVLADAGVPLQVLERLLA
jgi:hypothetical protein